MPVLAFALCSLLCVGSAAAQDQAQPPNIVLFLADDLGFSDTAPYGGEVATPTISELAALNAFSLCRVGRRAERAFVLARLRKKRRQAILEILRVPERPFCVVAVGV
jgi:hypothetical protein